MARLPAIDPTEMTVAQRQVYDAILAGPRTAIGGPFMAWLRSPELADKAQELGAYCRYNTSLPPRLSELAILITARHWRANVEWAIHAPIAIEAGLNKDIAAAILVGERPSNMSEDETVVYDYANALIRDRRVGDALHDRAIAAFGEQGTVELVGILGYYSLVAMTLNAFQVPVPDGYSAPFED